MESSINGMWIIPFKKFSMVKVKKNQTVTIQNCKQFRPSV